MKPYYELHITIRADDEDAANSIERVVNSMGWRFSKIDGDPELGVGVRCYATLQLNKRHTRAEVLSRLLGGRQHLWAAGCEVERIKIEEVVFDYRGLDAPVTAEIEAESEPLMAELLSAAVALRDSFTLLQEKEAKERLFEALNQLDV